MTQTSNPPAAPDRLLVFALGTFHASLLTVVLVYILHTQGTLHSLLGNLGTLRGFAVFLVLWGLSWWSTRGALKGHDLLRDDLGKIQMQALIWGALSGPVFLLALFALVILPELVMQGLFDGLAFIIVGLLIGSGFALIVGGVIGFLFGLIDSGVMAVVRANGGKALKTAAGPKDPLRQQDSPPSGLGAMDKE